MGVELARRSPFLYLYRLFSLWGGERSEGGFNGAGPRSPLLEAGGLIGPASLWNGGAEGKANAMTGAKPRSGEAKGGAFAGGGGGF